MFADILFVPDLRIFSYKSMLCFLEKSNVYSGFSSTIPVLNDPDWGDVNLLEIVVIRVDERPATGGTVRV